MIVTQVGYDTSDCFHAIYGESIKISTSGTDRRIDGQPAAVSCTNARRHSVVMATPERVTNGPRDTTTTTSLKPPEGCSSSSRPGTEAVRYYRRLLVQWCGRSVVAPSDGPRDPGRAMPRRRSSGCVLALPAASVTHRLLRRRRRRRCAVECFMEGNFAARCRDSTTTSYKARSCRVTAILCSCLKTTRVITFPSVSYIKPTSISPQLDFCPTLLQHTFFIYDHSCSSTYPVHSQNH